MLTTPIGTKERALKRVVLRALFEFIRRDSRFPEYGGNQQ